MSVWLRYLHNRYIQRKNFLDEQPRHFAEKNRNVITPAIVHSLSHIFRDKKRINSKILPEFWVSKKHFALQTCAHQFYVPKLMGTGGQFLEQVMRCSRPTMNKNPITGFYDFHCLFTRNIFFHSQNVFSLPIFCIV